MPVVLRTDDTVRVLGTAFTISFALVMTDRHVVEEIFALQDKFAVGRAQIGVLYLACPPEHATLPPKAWFGGLMPIWRVNYNASTDIALLNVNPPKPASADIPQLRMPAMPLTVTPPLTGSPCLVLGYTVETVLSSP